MADAATPIRTDTAPCVGCGLCCDGTMFRKASAERSEAASLAEAGLELFDEGEKLWFVHPCRYSENGLCTIYDTERWHVCRTFKCELLKRYQQGEIGLEEARSLIEKTVTLRDGLVADEPRTRLWKERRELRVNLETTKTRPHLLLKIAAFEYFLDKFFRGFAKRDDQPAEAISSRTESTSGR